MLQDTQHFVTCPWATHGAAMLEKTGGCARETESSVLHFGGNHVRQECVAMVDKTGSVLHFRVGHVRSMRTGDDVRKDGWQCSNPNALGVTFPRRPCHKIRGIL